MFAFALWGAGEFIYALLQWIVFICHRSLIPLMWGIQLFETLGRLLVGAITGCFYPNAAVSLPEYIYLVLAMLMLVLWSGRKNIECHK